jgi:hypothetical protein
MAFGLLTTKWQILKKPRQVSIRNAGKVFLSCAVLHNFVINERAAATNTAEDADESFRIDWCAGSGGSTGEQGNNRPFIDSDVSTSQLRGNSIMRDILVDRIADMALVRPCYNIERNKQQRQSNHNNSSS